MASSSKLRGAPTRFSIADSNVKCGNEFCKDGIDLIKASQNSDYVGAGIRVFLGQDRGKECRQGLLCGSESAVGGASIGRRMFGGADLECVKVDNATALLEGSDCPSEDLTGLWLQRNEVVGAQATESALETRPVGSQEEEFAPEAFRVLNVLLAIFLCVSGHVNMRCRPLTA